jgi:hypothetical protein
MVATIIPRVIETTDAEIRGVEERGSPTPSGAVCSELA